MTYKRPQLLMEALTQIWAQDYAGKLEVVVLDDSPESSAEFVAAFSDFTSMDINYRHLPYRCPLGGKRNLAAMSTEADIICIWDDDDLFPTNRITRQVCDIMTGKDCSHLETVFYYSSAKDQLNIHQRHVPILPIENSLCFRRDWFEAGRGFNPSSNFGEGLWLFDFSQTSTDGLNATHAGLEDLLPDGVARVPAEEVPFVYVKHGASVSGDQVEAGQLRRYSCGPVDRRLLGLARAFLEGRFPSIPNLPNPTRSRVLRSVRGAVGAAIAKDAAEFREDCDLASVRAYWQTLSGVDVVESGSTAAATAAPKLQLERSTGVMVSAAAATPEVDVSDLPELAELLAAVEAACTELTY